MKNVYALHFHLFFYLLTGILQERLFVFNLNSIEHLNIVFHSRELFLNHSVQNNNKIFYSTKIIEHKIYAMLSACSWMLEDTKI